MPRIYPHSPKNIKKKSLSVSQICLFYPKNAALVYPGVNQSINVFKHVSNQLAFHLLFICAAVLVGQFTQTT